MYVEELVVISDEDCGKRRVSMVYYYLLCNAGEYWYLLLSCFISQSNRSSCHQWSVSQMSNDAKTVGTRVRTVNDCINELMSW